MQQEFNRPLYAYIIIFEKERVSFTDSVRYFSNRNEQIVNISIIF